MSVATLVRRWEHLVAGASASKVCTLRLSSGFAQLCFPRSSTVVLPPLPALRRRSSHVAALHESALPEHLRVGRSWFVAMVWLSPASASGLQSRRSSVIATLRSCRRCGCVPRGQRALLDADMLELIDRSACLVEPVVVVESCASPLVLVLSPAASTVRELIYKYKHHNGFKILDLKSAVMAPPRASTPQDVEKILSDWKHQIHTVQLHEKNFQVPDNLKVTLLHRIMPKSFQEIMLQPRLPQVRTGPLRRHGNTKNGRRKFENQRGTWVGVSRKNM